MTYAGYMEKSVKFSGIMRKKINSSGDVNRSFCSNCGTPVSYESGSWPGEIHLMVSNFENPNEFTPILHTQIKDKIKWIHLGDDLPKYERFP